MDRHGAFRQFVYLSLLIGFPILIYIMLHFCIYCPTAWLLGRHISAISASALCLTIGLLVLIYFQANRSGNIEIKSIPAALRSNDTSVRIAALKTIRQKKLDVADFPSYPQLLKSPHARERYWLAVAMATSRSRKSYLDLLNFLEDNNTNVRSMAFHSLGARNNREAIQPILEKIKISQDWYAQLYAYRALRSLGWKQKKLH
jgi:HEAT repeat protein